MEHLNSAFNQLGKYKVRSPAGQKQELLPSHLTQLTLFLLVKEVVYQYTPLYATILLRQSQIKKLQKSCLL